MSTFIKAKVPGTDIVIPGLLVVEPVIHEDKERGGSFHEFLQVDEFIANGIPLNKLTQGNASESCKGVVRGLHFQKPPFAQGKLIKVVWGEVLDVAVDVRIGSPTYGKHFGVILSAKNKMSFWIPEDGFAHGFMTLTEYVVFMYFVTGGRYNKDSEGGLRWNDPSLNIDWPEKNGIQTKKEDAQWPLLKDLKSPFVYKG